MSGFAKQMLIAAALLAAVGMMSAPAQQTMRVSGTIEKVDGDKVVVKQNGATDVTLTLTANAMIVAVVKASLADIKSGDFVGSAAMPQADGSQKALEVHIFAESQRGTGDGHRPWDGAPNSTMTNGAVGETVTGVDGPVFTVKYKDGEKKIVVTPSVPIVRYEVGDKSEIKPGAAINVAAAAKKPDGTFTATRVNVGRGGLIP
jgi:hypothetical protein